MITLTKNHKLIAAILAGIAILMVVALSACHSTTTAAVKAPATQATTQAPAPPTTQAPPVQAPQPTTPSTPSMTVSQQQAVQAAQGYLSDGEGFSYEGLLQQLTSSYGDGFSHADAQFAINYLNPNWDAQAVASAQGYLDDGDGFSRSGLIQQLTSSYGSGFTTAQATYAVNKVMP
jgi:hypothetical protein